MLDRMPERAVSDPTQAPEKSPTWPTGFMVLHGNRLEDLRHLLIEHVRRFPLPGLEPEWVVLQSTGMKQWLEQGLASHQGLGICAATRMVFPAELLWHVYRVALGPDAVPTDLPLDREHLVWRLMRCLPAWLNGPDAACYDELRRYIQASDGRPDDARLLQLCQQLAGLYDGYQNYRSDWLGAWSLGDATLTDAAGRACPLPQDQHWQMRLWQQLRLDVLAEASQPSSLAPSRAEVHQAYMQRMAQGAPHGLPKRVLVFEIGRAHV